MNRTFGQWDASKPSVFRHYDAHCMPLGKKDMGGGVEVDAGGVSLEIVGGKKRCWFHITPPGWHSLFYAIEGKTLYFHESAAALRNMSRGCRPIPVEDGLVYVFDGEHGLRKYRGDQITLPRITKHTTKEFWELFLECAEEIYRLAGSPVCVTTISGGTDGIMTAVALEAIGARQICVCVGTDEEEFDPKYAREYAEEIGLSYEFIPVPMDDDSLDNLLYEALSSIEMADFSNVLMGMCNVLVRRIAKREDASHVFTADFADVILGNDMLTYGRFNKQNPTPTAEAWAAHRKQTQLHTLPNNMEVVRSFRAGGIDARQVFYHPRIIQFLLSCDFTLTPASSDKVIYKTIMNNYITNPAWKQGGRAKIGYYTGAGIGKVRLSNPILQDAHIREVYRRIVAS